MGDAEYITAFQRIILPIANEFNPELVLISAGFDAAEGDPLGGYNVSPAGFGQLTKLIRDLANGKVILCLEGGYNLDKIPDCMEMCVKALLGERLPQIKKMKPNASCLESVQKVLDVQKNYWTSLRPAANTDSDGSAGGAPNDGDDDNDANDNVADRKQKKINSIFQCIVFVVQCSLCLLSWLFSLLTYIAFENTTKNEYNCVVLFYVG